jgi:hypothetical protein
MSLPRRLVPDHGVGQPVDIEAPTAAQLLNS